ncbi:MAG: aldo/keto reductase [Microbacteriaceae bacterium]
MHAAAAVPEVPAVPLNDGATIPQLGLGVYKVPPEQAERVVADALELGYRHVDTASLYGNEREVGRAIAASGLPREAVFVTTKLWNSDQGYERALRAAEASLDALGLEAVDLYLIHWPAPALGLAADSWRALERLAAEGRARSIGVSNFLPHHLEALLGGASIVPAVNQIEVNPFLQQRDAERADAAHGIVTAAWSPLARGRVLGEPTLERIAAAHAVAGHLVGGQAVDVSAVVIAWHLARGRVVIPKTVSRQRMASNLAACRLRLSAAELAAIDALERGERSGSDPDRVGLER